MTPRVATVLSARDWERHLVAHAREAATLRLVLRAFRPEDVSAARPELDVVVAGSETAWVTGARIASWRRSGLAVIGIHPRGDSPARTRLEDAGADQVLADDVPPETIAHAAVSLGPAGPETRSSDPAGPVILVAGPRGAPGRTEMALALAWELGVGERRPILIDLDTAAPSLAIRLGVPPRPDVRDAIEGNHLSGHLPDAAIHRIGPIDLVVGSHREGSTPATPGELEDLVSSAAPGHSAVVLDPGPLIGDEHMVRSADRALLVVEGSPTGIVRAARVAAAWMGPLPSLILNRVPPRRRDDIVCAARRWTGLEPEAIIPHLPAVASAARRGDIPIRALRKTLSPLAGVPA
ncbi:hypothetical protein HQ535_07095 [bacterium]|nr:hypothetical protein [bacterium]